MFMHDVVVPHQRVAGALCSCTMVRAERLLDVELDVVEESVVQLGNHGRVLRVVDKVDVLTGPAPHTKQ